MTLKFKVWPTRIGGTRDDTRILLRTGVAKDAPDFGKNDVEDFFGSVKELVELAHERTNYVGTMFVKSFDTNKTWTLNVKRASGGLSIIVAKGGSW